MLRYTFWMPPFGDEDFEADPGKSASGFDKHAVAMVATAKIAFRGRLMRRQDTRKNYGEVRYQVLGEVYGKIYVIVYTPRVGKCRVISVRRADANEKAVYDQ